MSENASLAPPSIDGTLKVGHGRPPIHSRFKPGRSGNPKGRPKGNKSYLAIAENTLDASVTIHEGGKSKKVSAYEALLKREVFSAIQGNPKSVQTALKLGNMIAAQKTAELTSQKATLSAAEEIILEEVLNRAGLADSPIGEHK